MIKTSFKLYSSEVWGLGNSEDKSDVKRLDISCSDRLMSNVYSNITSSTPLVFEPYRSIRICGEIVSVLAKKRGVTNVDDPNVAIYKGDLTFTLLVKDDDACLGIDVQDGNEVVTIYSDSLVWTDTSLNFQVLISEQDRAYYGFDLTKNEELAEVTVWLTKAIADYNREVSKSKEPESN